MGDKGRGRKGQGGDNNENEGREGRGVGKGYILTNPKFSIFVI